MIAQETIDRVYEAADVVAVIGKFVELNRAGSNFKGHSPFVTEKSPSFMVSPSKNIYKCFSSGKGGTAISFLMDFKGMTYPEAIIYLAEQFDITVVHEGKEKTAEEVDHYQQLERCIMATHRLYQKALHTAPADSAVVVELYQNRQLTKDTVLEWQLGFAPDDWKYLTDRVIESGQFEIAKELGLVGTNDKGLNYNTYKNRIIFPIHDQADKLCGFGGRALGDDKAKYINSKDSKLYHKERILYGLNRAAQHIRKSGFAVVVEGYFDVVSLHQAGCRQTVGTCGTALTDAHLTILKRYTNHVIFGFDGDAAGQRALQKAVASAVKFGFKVDALVLPETEDPDSLARKWSAENASTFTDYLLSFKQDGILHITKTLFEAAKDAHARQDALNTVADVLQHVRGDLVLDDYCKQVAAITKVPIKNVKASIKLKLDQNTVEPTSEAESGLRWPKGADKDEFFRWGFFTLVDGEKTGYYFQNGNSGFLSVCNFVLTPIFHKYDQDDNTRVIKIDNGINPPEVVEMPSAAMVSVDQFKKFLFDKGTFLFFGNQQQLHKIQLRYLQDFPKAFELKTLGWQNEGFFAWYNNTFNGTLKPYDSVGLVKHGEKHFFSPAGSEIYTGFRQEDDMYENDRYLNYTPANITFETWAAKMKVAYDDHALSGVGFALVSLFKDQVFKVDNNCPHLYCYGASQSGKSKFAESITNLFFKELPAFNLNSGTDFAFANRLARFKNCPVFLNEFDDQVVKDEWFQSIKGAYDGEGRERGKGGSKKKTEIMRVNSALILVGQYLSTKDDNSVLSRSVMRVFHKKADRSKAQSDAYDFLKLAEKDGLSGCLTQLLQHRQDVEKEYYTRFNEVMKAMALKIRDAGKQFNERVLRNYSALVTLYEFFNERMTLPWKSDLYRQWAAEEVLMMSSMISTNDVLTDWWTTVETLFGEGLLREGEHFNIKDKRVIRLTEDGNDVDCDLGETKEVLYLRLKNVQQLYARFKRSMGMGAIDLTSLTSYLKNRAYYTGYINSEHFVKTRTTDQGNLEHITIKTSAHIFDFVALGISITRSKNVEAAAQTQDDKKEGDLPF